MNIKELEEHIKEQDKEIYELIAQCIELINELGWSGDDSYTFGNGETWRKFDPDNNGDIV